ncbi:MAG: S1 RNA-binding domain-containing protein, partial [Anaerolineaceae bacterium]
MRDKSGLYKNSNMNPEPDEGWWASVLADEDAIVSEKADTNSRNNQTNFSGGCTNWENVKNIFLRDEVIELEVYGFNRGGLLVKGEGIQGFVPVSHLVDLPGETSDDERQEQLAKYEGSSLWLKVIECEPASERVVLSERAAQAGEGKRKLLFESLKPGLHTTGLVTNVTDFGVFVDLGGVEGLVHVSELSWGRVEQPSALFTIGQSVDVMVLQVNESTARIALSIKRLTENPWDTMQENHQKGDIVSANVTAIQRFGVFARLPEGIEGLIHISSISDFYGSSDATKLFKVGQLLTVKILHIDAERR